MRKHLVKSAGYWYNGAQEERTNGNESIAYLAYENAYNHVENALAAALDIIKELGEYGEKEWDETDFKEGYKKVNSGLINKSRRFLKDFDIKVE